MAGEKLVTFIVTEGSKCCEVRTESNPYIYVIRETKVDALAIAFTRYLERVSGSESTTIKLLTLTKEN